LIHWVIEELGNRVIAELGHLFIAIIASVGNCGFGNCDIWLGPIQLCNYQITRLPNHL